MQKEIKVWDPVVRIGHWVLVIAFFTAYFTEDDFLSAHVWAGYTVTAVILFRILWGFIGTTHAKFKDFIYSPIAVFNYLGNLLRGKPQHYIGHNPAGGAMVIALLIGLCGTSFTGLKLYAVEENAGPFATQNVKSESANSLIPVAKAEEKDEDEAHEKSEKAQHEKPLANQATPAADVIAPAAKGEIREDEDAEHEGKGEAGEAKAEEAKEGAIGEGDEEGEEFWEELHETFVNFTLLLVVLHILGVIFSSIVDKENFVKAMVTGRKQVGKQQD